MSYTEAPQNIRVALLCGGKSGEREISLASGEGALAALQEAGFSVTVFDPAKKEDLMSLVQGSFDVAFLCMHGKYGEDGTLQGFLEMIDLPYTGSGVCASAIAMDKNKAKVLYREAGVPTPISQTLYKGQHHDTSSIIEATGTACVVKPATEGSALGVFIVDGERELQEAIAKAFEFDSTVLVEQYIAGKELTVAVIDKQGQSSALPVIEIVPQNDFYDFESKYAPGGSKHICPAPLNDQETLYVQELAVRAHRALGCEGVSRTDIIVDAEGNAWVLETNTLPGMTATSLLPDAAKEAGLSFSQLCTQLINEALWSSSCT